MNGIGNANDNSGEMLSRSFKVDGYIFDITTITEGNFSTLDLKIRNRREFPSRYIFLKLARRLFFIFEEMSDLRIIKWEIWSNEWSAIILINHEPKEKINKREIPQQENGDSPSVYPPGA